MLTGARVRTNDDEARDRDLVVLVTFIRNWVKLFVICVGAGVALAIAVTFLKTPNYTARVTIVPNASDGGQMGLLGGLAAQAGFAIGTSSSYEDVYVHFLKSRRLIEPMLERKWRSSFLNKDASIFEIFDVERVEGDSISNAWAIEQVLRIMRDRVIHFQRDPITGFMVLEV